MKDPRIAKLAKNLINYSVKLQPGEKILIENFKLESELVTALVKEAYAAGGFPFVSIKDHKVDHLSWFCDIKTLTLIGTIIEIQTS